MYRGKYLLPTIFLLTIFCALHENPFDPASPYHKPPVLAVELQFDSTRIIGEINRNDDHLSFSADAPFPCTLTVSSRDYFSSSKRLQVKFEHSLKKLSGDETIKRDDTLNDTILILDEGGLHILRFTTDSDYGATSSSEIEVTINTKAPPIIKEIIALNDTLPLHPPLDSRGLTFVTVIVNDTDFCADSIYYVSDYLFEIIGHKLETADSNGIAIDESVPFNFSPSFPDTLHATIIHLLNIILVDSLKRRDTVQYPITFLDNIIRGFPPHIDSIYIISDDSVLYQYRPIKFGVEASDYVDPSPNDDDTTTKTPKDGSAIQFKWDFGNGRTIIEKEPTYIFQEPDDSFFVKVTAIDDSNNTHTDSICVTIKPAPLIPRFTDFSVAYTLSLPCTTYTSLTVTDDDGYIKYIFFLIGSNSFMSPLSEITDMRHILTEKKVYNLFFLAYDNDGNTCDTSFTIDLSGRL
ncbi:MAG: PKD domain-containing protein [Chitinispirillaceae bacterium]|nr:PKD domain-containing protein [Chitinispirillaceae bacterium]